MATVYEFLNLKDFGGGITLTTTLLSARFPYTIYSSGNTANVTISGSLYPVQTHMSIGMVLGSGRPLVAGDCFGIILNRAGATEFNGDWFCVNTIDNAGAFRFTGNRLFIGATDTGIDVPVTEGQVVAVEFHFTSLTSVSVYMNNALMGTTTVPFTVALLRAIGICRSYGGYRGPAYLAWWHSNGRLGMPVMATVTPTTNANTGTVTGTLPAALTTFDGDTSRVTYTEGSAQATVLNAAGLSAIPSDAVIHAVKLTASAAGAGGVAAGELTLETAAGASDVGEINMALGYSQTTVMLNADPATSAAFIASELAAGTIKFGVREG